jgi:hypothetical protein
VRRFFPWVICVTWWVSACSTTVPTLPTPNVEPPPPNGPSRRQANWPTPTVFTSLAVSGQTSSRVTDADPQCDPRSANAHCQFFRVDAPGTGLLTVTMTWSASSPGDYPLDIEVTDSEGWTWDGVATGPQRRVTLDVQPRTYWVTVWSSPLQPGEPFILTTSFAPK